MKPFQEIAPRRTTDRALILASSVLSVCMSKSVCLCEGGVLQHHNISILNIDLIKKKLPSEVWFTITTLRTTWGFMWASILSNSSAYEWCLPSTWQNQTHTTPEFKAHYIPFWRGHSLHKSLWPSEFHKPALCIALKVELIIPLLKVDPNLTSIPFSIISM